MFKLQTVLCQTGPLANLGHGQRQAKMWHWHRIAIDCVGALGRLVTLNVVAHDLRVTDKNQSASAKL
jgi:hypothetical protein